MQAKAYLPLFERVLQRVDRGQGVAAGGGAGVLHGHLARPAARPWRH